MKHIPIRTTSLSILIAVLLLAAVVLLACGPASQSDPGLAPSGPVTAKDDAATSTPKPKEDPKYPNLSPFLQDLAQLYDANELTEEQIAAKAPMYHGPQVFVDIDIVNDLAEHKDLLGASVNRSIVSKWLENEGALPKSVGPEYRPPYIYAWVKVSDLGALSQQSAVTSVTELHDLDGSFAKMVADGNAVLYLPIWVKNDPYERLDYDLAELLFRYKMGEITAEQVGTEYQGRTDSKVFLDIELASDPVNTKAIASWLEEEGVVPRSVSKTEQYVNIISAEVPVSLLDTLAGQPLVIRIHSGFGEAPETGGFIPRSDIGLPKSNHYQNPDANSYTKEVVEVSREIHRDQLATRFRDTSHSFQLAAVVAEYAEILRETHWTQDGSLYDVAAEAHRVRQLLPEQPSVAEFTELAERTQWIAQAASR